MTEVFGVEATENDAIAWWRRPRRVSIVVDNPSWVAPYAEELARRLRAEGDDVALCARHADVNPGEVAFFLGCMHIAKPEILARNQRNLVVHASDLPRGRGFSPLSWMILEGRNDIPVCLLNAVEELDAGDIIDRVTLRFRGHELIDEMRAELGAAHVSLCHGFMTAPSPAVGAAQQGAPSFYARRRPSDSELDVNASLATQFELLRIVDNAHYPAFFRHRGCAYRLTIEKLPQASPEAEGAR